MQVSNHIRESKHTDEKFHFRDGHEALETSFSDHSTCTTSKRPSQSSPATLAGYHYQRPFVLRSRRLFRAAYVISSSLLSGRKNISPLRSSKQRSFSGRSRKELCFGKTIGRYVEGRASFQTYFWFLEMSVCV